MHNFTKWLISVVAIVGIISGGTMAWKGLYNLQAETNDNLTAAKWNKLVKQVETLNTKAGIIYEADGETISIKRGEADLPGLSCKHILDDGGSIGNGNYWIQPTGENAAYEVYCDMTIDGGGWTLVNTKKTNIFSPWKGTFDKLCATNTTTNCASSINNKLDYSTVMWKFEDTDSYQIFFDTIDHAGLMSFLQGENITADIGKNINFYKTINGLDTEKTIVTFFYSTDANISEAHDGGSDAWVDLWNTVDGTNSYISSDLEASRGTKCLGGYCRSEAVLMMVR